MIATSRLLEYPLLAIAPEMQAKFNSAHQKISTKKPVIAYINSFFHVTGVYLHNKSITSLEDIEATISGFEGYLLSNTNFTATYVAQSYNKAKKLLAETIGIKWTPNKHTVKNTKEERQQHSITFYKLMKKSDSVLKYYTGWWVTSRDGRVSFLNLIQPYLTYGEETASYILSLVDEDCKRFADTSCDYRTVHLKRILNFMSILYPTKETLLLLQTGKNVNEFVELLFARCKADTISNNFSLKAFYNNWPGAIQVFYEILTGTALMASPEWPLLCPTYKSANLQDEKDVAFDQAIMQIPLTFSDEKAFEMFEAAVNDELKFIEKFCIKACEKEMKHLHSTINSAKAGRVITSFRWMILGEDFTEDDVCRTWQEFGYNIAQTGLFTVLSVGKFLKIVRPLRAHTLLPFMHLLVQHHPFITPPWLIKFELFDAHGQQVDYTQSDGEWIATSFKPRAKGHEQQSVVLTETTKRIFDEIIAITADARSYLRSIGDPNYRRLFLSGGKGLAKPTPIDIITPVSRMDSDIPLRYVMMHGISKTFTIERVERIISRLTLRSLRDTVAIQIYTLTMSMLAVAEALRHAPGNEKSSKGYIPDALRFFMMERWLRLFQNAIIYESMKNSPYLLQAMDFNTLEELSDFLRTHKEHYKVVPDNEPMVYQTTSALDNEEFDRMYIDLNLDKLEVLLCIYEIVHAALRTGTQMAEGALRWYPVATLLYQAVHLHKEGTLSGYCSRSVLALFARANPSHQLMEKIKGVIHA